MMAENLSPSSAFSQQRAVVPSSKGMSSSFARTDPSLMDAQDETAYGVANHFVDFQQLKRLNSKSINNDNNPDDLLQPRSSINISSRNKTNLNSITGQKNTQKMMMMTASSYNDINNENEDDLVQRFPQNDNFIIKSPQPSQTQISRTPSAAPTLKSKTTALQTIPSKQHLQQPTQKNQTASFTGDDAFDYANDDEEDSFRHHGFANIAKDNTLKDYERNVSVEYDLDALTHQIDDSLQGDDITDALSHNNKSSLVAHKTTKSLNSEDVETEATASRSINQPQTQQRGYPPASKDVKKAKFASSKLVGKIEARFTPADEETLTVGSTIKTSSSASMATMSRKLSDAIFRRPVTRAFLLIWIFIMVYVATSLIICITSVAQFTSFYDKTANLMMASFDFSVATLFSVFVERGFIDYISTPRQNHIDWTLKHVLRGRSTLFATIDGPSERASTTLGRAYSEGEHLLYSPVCLPELLDQDNPFFSYCDQRRNRFDTYPLQGQLQEGLVRAVIVFHDSMQQHVFKYANNPNTIMYPANAVTWFRYDALVNDLEPGMIALRGVVSEAALSRVVKDSLTQLLLLGGGILAAILMGIIMEFVLRRQMVTFKDTMLLLRLIPTRLTDDYKVVEKVLHIQSDDDELDVASTTNLGGGGGNVFLTSTSTVKLK
eukprot:GDKJ01061747.1.p1 GENE.GDKJ01061747.1~~GDKJ01061747.1.p1  ORF type:complete len:663 (+),score=172.78 GDKJ01061747.1:1229-3217(+)